MVIAIGPEMHDDSIRTSIATGIEESARIWGDGVDPSDSLQWAKLAAAAVSKVGDAQLVIFGKESIDVGSDQHAYQTARKLGWTMLSYVSNILEFDPEAGTIRVEKVLEQGTQVLTARLPAVLTVLKGNQRTALPVVHAHPQG